MGIKKLIAYIVLLVALSSCDNKVDTKELYEMYVCSNTNHSTKEECVRNLVGVAEFKIDKNLSTVFVIYNDEIKNEKKRIPLQNCEIKDDRNWKCGGGINFNNIEMADIKTNLPTKVGYITEYSTTQNINGEIKVTDTILKRYQNGLEEISYSKPPIFLRIESKN